MIFLSRWTVVHGSYLCLLARSYDDAFTATLRYGGRHKGVTQTITKWNTP